MGKADARTSLSICCDAMHVWSAVMCSKTSNAHIVIFDENQTLGLFLSVLAIGVMSSCKMPSSTATSMMIYPSGCMGTGLGRLLYPMDLHVTSLGEGLIWNAVTQIAIGRC
eukprot:3040902-Amphidinium_carterae.1